jgi:hypothetical protein
METSINAGRFRPRIASLLWRKKARVKQRDSALQVPAESRRQRADGEKSTGGEPASGDRQVTGGRASKI